MALPEAIVPAVPHTATQITRLTALEIKFDKMTRDGVVKDQAELARLGFVTRARVTQIMNLLNLAAPIQKVILSAAATSQERDRVTERQLRQLLKFNEWSGQSITWAAIGDFAS